MPLRGLNKCPYLRYSQTRSDASRVETIPRITVKKVFILDFESENLTNDKLAANRFLGSVLDHGKSGRTRWFLGRICLPVGDSQSQLIRVRRQLSDASCKVLSGIADLAYESISLNHLMNVRRQTGGALPQAPP